uniref:Putative secreted protein n=1 Tax=Ixodes ricinus TaxID=34613 RepID=A0A6B0UH52_IXORI
MRLWPCHWPRATCCAAKLACGSSVALLQIPEPTACPIILLSLRWASTENATFKLGSFGRHTSSKEVAKRATGKLQRRKVHPRQLTLTSVGAARRRFRVRSLEFHRQR